MCILLSDEHLQSVEEINARMKARQAQLDDQSTDVESTLHPRVQNLVRELFDVDTMNLTLSELEFDASRMPLGEHCISNLYCHIWREELQHCRVIRSLA